MENEELSLKEIINILKEYYQYLKSKVLIIAVISIIVGAGFGIYNYMQKPSYFEKLTFMMDETESSRGDMFASIKTLGDLFGGGGKSESSLGKILQLFESRKIIHLTLFDSIEIQGKNDFLANHILNLYTVESLVHEYRKFHGLSYKVNWPKILLKDPEFRFTSSDVDNFTPRQNLYLRLLYEHITGNRTADIEPKLNSLLDEETGIMAVNMNSDYEELTIGVLNNIYGHLSEFFIETSVKKQRKTYEIMVYKRDSIIGELKTKEYSLANFKDSNRKLVSVKGYLTQLRLEREVQILNIMYAEVVKQLEMTDFTLRNMTPVVQIIDLPRRPIIPFKPPWKTGFINGFVLGLVLAILFFLGRLLLRDLLSNRFKFFDLS